MKKFYLILLLLGSIAHSTSFMIMAGGNDEVAVPSKVAPTIDEKKLAEVFNVALQNPEIRKQLQDVVAIHHSSSVTDREVYEKMMMAANIDLMAKMAKSLEPKKKKAKPTMSQKVFGEIKSMLTETTKLSAQCALLMFITIKLLGYTPVVGPVVNGLDWAADVVFNAPEVAAACPNALAWIMNAGYCG